MPKATATLLLVPLLALATGCSPAPAASHAASPAGSPASTAPATSDTPLIEPSSAPGTAPTTAATQPAAERTTAGTTTRPAPTKAPATAPPTGSVVLRYPCAAQSHDLRLDCNHDDYYSTNPPAGSYLAQYYNVADNLFLIKSGGGGPTPTGNLALSATPTASYTSAWESINAINDGAEPATSNDTVNPRWGTWPQTGTQWAELTWATAQHLAVAEIYFFDDNGGVRLPASWKLQYWNGSTYVDVPAPSGYPVDLGRYNRVTFGAVDTTRLRVVLQSGQGSVGLLEVKALSS